MTPYISLPENAAKKETLVVDARGRPLITREPRAVGFRPPVPERKADRGPNDREANR